MKGSAGQFWLAWLSFSLGYGHIVAGCRTAGILKQLGLAKMFYSCGLSVWVNTTRTWCKCMSSMTSPQ